MTATPKTFYKVRCDGDGSGVACGETLTDGEHDYWDTESIEAWISEGEWIAWTRQAGPDTHQEHYCFGHWVYCEECGERIPVPYVHEHDGAWRCDRCGTAAVDLDQVSAQAHEAVVREAVARYGNDCGHPNHGSEDHDCAPFTKEATDG